MPLKVGMLLSNPGGVGGAETMVVRLSRGLQALANHQIVVYVLGEDTWIHNQGEKLGFRVVSIPKLIQKHWSINKLPITGVLLARFFKEQGINVLHSHMYPGIVRGALAALFGSFPHIATLHDTYSVKDKPSRIRWLKYASWLGTKIVTISQEMFNSYTGFGRLNSQRVSVIYNGIDVEQFAAPPHRPPRDTLNITSVGRLVPIKGYDVLIDAIEMIRDMNVKVTILGDGPERTRLCNLVSQKNLNNIINFPGASNDIAKHLSYADAFVLSSHSEGLSCSIIEAMSASLPIVATNVGGNRELVFPEKNGYLTLPSNATDLSSQILKLASLDPKQRQAMGLCSNTLAKERFSLKKMVSEYNKLYYHAIGNNL